MEMMRTIPVATVASTSVATVFTDNLVSFYVFRRTYWPTKGPKLVLIFSATFAVHTTINHLTTTIYHPQTNSQVEHFNQTIVACLGHYVAENKTGWYQYEQPLSYRDKVQSHWSIGVIPSNFVLFCKPLAPATPQSSHWIPDAMTELPQPQSSSSRLLGQLDVLRKQLHAKHTSVEACLKCSFDGTVRWTSQFSPIQYVFTYKSAAGMIESGRMMNALFSSLMSNTICSFRQTNDATNQINDFWDA